MITSINGLPPNENIERFKELQNAATGKSNETKISNEKKVTLEKTGKLAQSEKGSNSPQDVQINFREISQKLESMLDEDNRSIQFSLDKESKKMIMKVIDSETNEVIQQFPPEISLKIARIVAASMDNFRVTNAKI